MSTLPRVVVVGAGGHAHVIVEILQEAGTVDLVGVLDPGAVRDVLGVPNLGGDERLSSLLAEGITGAVAAIGDNRARQALFERILAAGLTPVNAIHPSATISRSATLGRGVVVMAHVVLNALCRIGDNAIVNTGATVDHHGSIGAHAHIAPGCHLAGRVTVGDGVFLGTGVMVTPNVSIGAAAFVSAGLTITRDVAAEARIRRPAPPA